MITLTLLALALTMGLALLTRRTLAVGHGRDVLVRALESRWIVPLVGVVTSVALWWTWGALRPVPVFHDETAYLLQADIFAHFRWAAPPPPIAAFFEQAHVLVDPAVAAKYPPGHSLVLALGALVGWPALVIVALLGLTGALTFALARRVANGAVALLTWVLWLTCPTVHFFGLSYFSEITTAACWLAGWLALLEWRSSRRRRWLVTLALLVGWGAITRPLTMLLYAIPVGVVVLRDVVTELRWRDLAAALVAGVAVLAILPLWSARTTGSWRETPLSRYTAQYMPWDVPGFGLNAAPPSRELTRDLSDLSDVFRPLHETHQPATLPASFRDRLRAWVPGTWGPAHSLLFPFALFGLFTLGTATGFALATGMLLLVGYLAYATFPMWTVYYLEAAPVFAYLTAAGIAAAASWLAGMPRVRLRNHEWRAPALHGVLAIAGLSLAVPVIFALRHARQNHVAALEYHSGFEGVLARLSHPAVLFVRYSATHNPHASLVRNSADPEREPVWVAYDRGAMENARLLALAPGRSVYLYDEAKSILVVYPRPAAATLARTIPP